MKITATARVQILVEVRVPSTWGPECSIGQLHKQAAGEARAKLLVLAADKREFTIVGEPDVVGIITTSDGNP